MGAGFEFTGAAEFGGGAGTSGSSGNGLALLTVAESGNATIGPASLAAESFNSRDLMDMTNFWRSAAMAACPLCTTQGVGDDEGLAGVAATDAPAVLAEDESLGAEPVPLRPAGRSSVAHSSGVASAVAQALAQRMGVSVNDVEVAATASPDGSGVEFAYAVQPGSAESADVLSSETAAFYVTALHAEDIAYVEQVAPGASVTAGDRKGVRLRQCAVCRHELAKAAYSRSQWGRTLGRGAPTCMDCLQPRSRNSECSEPMSTQGVGDDGSPTGPRGLTKDVRMTRVLRALLQAIRREAPSVVHGVSLRPSPSDGSGPGNHASRGSPPRCTKIGSRITFASTTLHSVGKRAARCGTHPG